MRSFSFFKVAVEIILSDICMYGHLQKRKGDVPLTKCCHVAFTVYPISYWYNVDATLLTDPHMLLRRTSFINFAK